MFLTLRLQFHAVMMMHAHWEVLPVLQAFEMIVLPSCGYKKELIPIAMNQLAQTKVLLISSFSVSHALWQRPFVISVSPCDCNGGARNLIFIFVDTPLQGRRKLISVFIGAAISLFITNAHEVLSPSLFTVFTLLKAAAHRKDAVCINTTRRSKRRMDMRFMCACCDKALCVDPCFKDITL